MGRKGRVKRNVSAKARNNQAEEASNLPNKLPPRVTHEVGSPRGEFFGTLCKVAGLDVNVLNAMGWGVMEGARDREERKKRV